MQKFISLVLAAAAAAALAAGGQPTAARSVHLFYRAGESDAMYNEVTPLASGRGTFFMACGWSGGYFGIQDVSAQQKQVIFSVWDPPGDDGREQQDPKNVPASRQVKLLHRHPLVKAGRFGNEGTGGQSFLPYQWALGRTYRFLVHARRSAKEAGRVEYTAYFHEGKKWHKLATFSAHSKNLLTGQYSFIENFIHEPDSQATARRARFGGTYLRIGGRWLAATGAAFTADSNPAQNIDAGREHTRFWLATGGAVRNDVTKLGGTIELADVEQPPTDLPALP